MLNRSRRQSCACDVNVKRVMTLAKIYITLTTDSPNYPNKI